MNRLALTALAAGTLISWHGLSAAHTSPTTCKFSPATPLKEFVGVQLQAYGARCFTNGIVVDRALTHVLRIDLGAEGVSVEASSRPTPSLFFLELPSQFLAERRAQIAVNANLFALCCYYTTMPGRITALRGWEMANGVTLSPPGPPPNDPYNRPFDASLMFGASNAAQIAYTYKDKVPPSGYQTALTGSHMLVYNGANIAPATIAGNDFYGANARTEAGLTAGNRTLLLVAVDRSTLAHSKSRGLTLDEAAQLLITLGAVNAINLDGGGSSSMVMQSGTGFSFLNVPSDLPSTGGCTVYYPIGSTPPHAASCERYVGASLAIHADPLPARSPH